MASSIEGITPTHEADVVIIGGGGAGMSAALSATEADDEAEVILIQKISELGGSTTMSVGSITVSESHLQEERGIVDSSEAHFKDIDKFIEEASEIERYAQLGAHESLRDRDDISLREILVENSGDTLEWLSEHGCEYAGPYLEPPHRVPRMHQITPDTKAYRDILGGSLEERGVEILYETEAYELITEDNEVIGVLAKRSGQRNPLIISSSEGVILATGDYVNSMEYRERYTDDALSEPINEHNTGDGHRMAQEVGADLVNMDMQYPIFRFGDPLYTGPEVLDLLEAGSILVSGSGNRFINEDSDYDQIYDSVLRQDMESMYIVFDSEIADTFTSWPNFISTLGRDSKAFGFVEFYLQTGYLSKITSWEGIREVGGIEGENLQQTIQGYNTGVYDEAHDMIMDNYGRTESRTKLTEFPLYVLGPISPYVVITLGGVKINDQMQVVDTEGEPIPNLYAAGSIAGSFLLFGHGHHHSWIFTTGRIAGGEVLN